MKKRTIFIILSLIFGLLLMGGIYISYYFMPRDIGNIKLADLDDKEFNLSKKEYIEDFDFAYDILEKYYPYFRINKKIYDVDWLSKKNFYRNYISLSQNDEDFFNRMNDILSELNNGHTHLVDRDFGFYCYLTYYALPRYDWRNDIANIYEKDKVRRRYKITNESLRSYIENHYTNYGNTGFSLVFRLANRIFSIDKSFYQEERMTLDNFTSKKLIDGKLAYMKIKKMLSPEQMSSDEIVLDEFLRDIKNYPNLIIDIRGNGGGDSRYWQEFILPKIIGKSYKTTNYNFLKKGELNKKVIIQESYHANIKDFLKNSSFPNEIKEYLENFDYYNNEDVIVDPKKDSINFKGNIYLLVDENVYSSAEMLTSFCKETGLAKIVGSRTGGDGIGSDPMQIDLPNTGYVLRFPKNMGLTKSGSINELDQTTPDIKVETSQFDENLFDQKSIQAVMKDAGLL